MRIFLKPGTVKKIEEVTGQHMSTRCDRIINKLIDDLKRMKIVRKNHRKNQDLSV